MLRKSWDDVSEQTIVNCFRKAGISEKSQEAVDEDDDPFRSLCTDVDDSIADLEFNLDQLRQINPELAPDELDAAGLVDIDACIATNQSQAVTVEEMVSDFTEEYDVPLMEVDSDSDDEEDTPFTCPSWNDVDVNVDVDEAMELLSKFNLFSKDADLGPLLSKLEHKINQR